MQEGSSKGSKDVVSGMVEAGIKQQLWKLHQTNPLEQVVKDLCEVFDHSYQPGKFALQYVEHDHYVTEENRSQIKDGFILRLVYSPEKTVKILLPKLSQESSVAKEDRKYALEKLASICCDPVFSHYFVSMGGLSALEQLLSADGLTTVDLSNCLHILLWIHSQGLVSSIQEAVLQKLLSLVLSEEQMEPTVTQRALGILRKVVLSGGSDSSYVEATVSLNELIPHLWNRDQPEVQQAALALINSLAQSDSRQTMIGTMASRHARETIVNNILSNAVSPAMAHELHVYQSLILNLQAGKLFGIVDSKAVEELNTAISKAEKTSKRHSEMPVFVAPSTPLPPSSSQRITMRRSHSTTDTTALSETESLIVNYESGLCPLTIEWMTYFVKRYIKTFFQVMLEEKTLFHSFPSMCERITRIICDVLGIGKPLKNEGILYQPLVFSLNSSTTFLRELFCRTFLLLGRTRRDMKARTLGDQEKVLAVLKRQLKEAVCEQPTSLEALSRYMRRFSYEDVCKMWQKEREELLAQELNASPPIQQLKESLSPGIVDIVKQQRLALLCAGTCFPCTSPRQQKGKKKWRFVQLSPNHKNLHYGDCDNQGKYIAGFSTIALTTVTALATGKRCPHVREARKGKSEPDFIGLAFSLLLEAELQSLDFIAPDRKTYDCWIDGINLLIGNKMDSHTMKEDLTTMLDLEIRLRLLDIEGVSIPHTPPPIPVDPPNYNFYFK